jgi:glucose-1-phosphate adenylyltransferase
MSHTIAFVLAGGRVDEMGVLTAQRPKAAVPFGGTYRTIDFALSNLASSGIEQVGILSQYRPYSLMDHIGVGEPWGFVGRYRTCEILSPYQGANEFDWYRGTADALYQNLHFIKRYAPERVMVVSGDHVYRMNYRALIEAHKASAADLTVAFRRVAPDQCSSFGIGTLDDAGRLVRYEEKPRQTDSNLASLTIYLFETAPLVRWLEENQANGRTYQIYDEILPKAVAEGRARGYVFDDYWSYTRTVDAWYQANFECVRPGGILSRRATGVLTNQENQELSFLPPARIDPRAQVSDSVVSPGCVIEGSLTGSILGPNVRVHPGAQVRGSILLHDVVVEPGAILDGVVADKGVHIGRDATIGLMGPLVPNSQIGAALSSGVNVFGKNARIPAGLKVEKNVMVAPGIEAIEAKVLASGSTVCEEGIR